MNYSEKSLTFSYLWVLESGPPCVIIHMYVY